MSYFWKKDKIVKKLLMLAVLMIALFSWNCEKDDICDENTSTTPRLIIQFYDISNPTDEKNVTNLKVTGFDRPDSLAVFNNVSRIELPLDVTTNSAGYILQNNSTNATAINNADRLQFNYTQNTIYVSRACGYKSVFTLDPVTPYVLTDSEDADGFWIQDIEVIHPEIQNENEVHVNIYFTF
jgi:hypothetical protein